MFVQKFESKTIVGTVIEQQHIIVKNKGVHNLLFSSFFQLKFSYEKFIKINSFCHLFFFFLFQETGFHIRIYIVTVEQFVYISIVTR